MTTLEVFCWNRLNHLHEVTLCTVWDVICWNWGMRADSVGEPWSDYLKINSISVSCRWHCGSWEKPLGKKKKRTQDCRGSRKRRQHDLWKVQQKHELTQNTRWSEVWRLDSDSWVQFKLMPRPVVTHTQVMMSYCGSSAWSMSDILCVSTLMAMVFCKR